MFAVERSGRVQHLNLEGLPVHPAFKPVLVVTENVKTVYVNGKGDRGAEQP